MCVCLCVVGVNIVMAGGADAGSLPGTERRDVAVDVVVPELTDHSSNDDVDQLPDDVLTCEPSQVLLTERPADTDGEPSQVRLPDDVLTCEPSQVLLAERPADTDDRADQTPDGVRAHKTPVNEAADSENLADMVLLSGPSLDTGDRGNIADKLLYGDRDKDIEQVPVPGLGAGRPAVNGGRGDDADNVPDGSSVDNAEKVILKERPADIDVRDDTVEQIFDGDRGYDDVHLMPVTESLITAEKVDREKNLEAELLMMGPPADSDDREKLADKVPDGYHDNETEKALVNGRHDDGIEQVAAQVCCVPCRYGCVFVVTEGPVGRFTPPEVAQPAGY